MNLVEWGGPDKEYRYTLWRLWALERGLVQFIGLNPSTADETNDDPTIRRCIGFAKAWGYGGICMTNLFAFRATRPSDMTREREPVGPDNDGWLAETANVASLTVAAWGVRGSHLGRDRQVQALIPNMKCLGLTKQGHPAHPLYLSKGVPLLEYNREFDALVALRTR